MAPLMVMDRGAVAITGGEEESVTCTVKSEAPGAVGLPEITPLLPIQGQADTARYPR